mgnify:FL=1|jgi:hypothetical protein
MSNTTVIEILMEEVRRTFPQLTDEDEIRKLAEIILKERAKIS